ncbi:MAG TPA: 30S ribosomal protein S19 [Sphaerochaeta sp.]|nr:30S ribosomal protein S19 [Sphaerochaeta sp.]
MARSIKKGPFVERKLYKRVQEAVKANQKPMIKTYSRASVIIPEMVGFTISVYNGKTWIPVFVTENLVGHKLGEFAPTRMFRGHASDRKAGR